MNDVTYGLSAVCSVYIFKRKVRSPLESSYCVWKCLAYWTCEITHAHVAAWQLSRGKGGGGCRGVLTCAVIPMDCILHVLKDENVAELGGAGSKNRDAVRISLSWAATEV
jgi:hypothetical protein